MPKSLVPHPGDDTWRLEMCGEAVWKAVWKLLVETVKIDKRGKV